MTIKFTNNAFGTLATGISAGDTSLTLTAAQGARFPALSAGDYFYATLVDTANNLEIIKVTARATDTLTIVRAQDGTSARAYLSGDRLELRWCNAASLVLQQEGVAAVATTGTDTYTATLSPAPTGYNTNQVYAIRFGSANTVAAPTLNLNAFGAKTIKRPGGGGVHVGGLVPGIVTFLLYDGTDFIILNYPALEISFDTSGTDTYTATPSPSIIGWENGRVYTVRFTNANTSTAPTLNLNGVGAKTIKKGASAALSPGDIQAGMPAKLQYNGTDLILLNPAKGALRGKETIWVPANAMVARITQGAVFAASTESTTNKVMLQTIDFADGANALHAQFGVGMPKGWDLGTVTAKFHWTASSGTGNVVWGVQGVAISDDDPIDAAFGTAQTVTDGFIVANDMHISGDTAAITIAGTPAARDHVFFQVYRDPPNASDTFTGTARLIGVEVTVNFGAADAS